MSEDERRFNLTIEDWLAITHLLNREEPPELDPATEEAWQLLRVEAEAAARVAA